MTREQLIAHLEGNGMTSYGNLKAAQMLRADAALEAQLAEARKDAERLDWLETQQDVMWQTHDGQWHGGPGNDARDMVDKARGADNSAPQGEDHG